MTAKSNIITLVLLLGSLTLTAQSKSDGLIIGEWQLYPNVDVGEIEKYVRPESIGVSVERLNPNTRLSFGQRAVYSTSRIIGTPTKSGLVEDGMNLLASGGTGAYLWFFESDRKSIIFTEYEDTTTAVVEYDIVKLTAESLWLKKK